MFALLDVTANARVTHHRPDFGISSVMVGPRKVAVREEVALSLPFGDLLHFAKDEIDVAQPRLLLVAPLSGHFATLLRSTVETLLQDHDVYITDWANARDVPLSAGNFGFDDYVDYLIRFLEHLGPESHVMAVCQPCVQTLVAVAVMAEARNPALPRSMTLMGGPVDTRVSPTVVNELATSKPIGWFEDNLISEVPLRFAGAGRRVYPGFLQLTAFMSMNLERHTSQHRRLYQLLADGHTAEAEAIQDFYREYFAVLDLAAEFYLETVDRVFQQALLARGLLEHRGRRVRPDPRVEVQIAENLKRAEASTNLVLEPRLADQLIRRLIPAAESMMRESLSPVLLCRPEIRRALKTFTRRTIPRLAILSVNEIPHTIDLTSFSVVKLEA